MTRLLLAVFAHFVLAAVPASSQTAGDATAELLKIDREWAQAAATRDVERIVSYWTDDAVIYAPGTAPVEGKAAIRAYVSESLKVPGFAITWTPLKAVVSKSGDLGYTTGTNAVTVPNEQGGTSTLAGRYVTVWTKAKDGQWRCTVDSWSPGPAPSAPGSIR